jgi:hypothetical protein
MISDNDLENLPAGNEAAFVRLVDLLNERLANGNPESWEFRAQQYAQVLLAFIDEHNLELGMTSTLDRHMPGESTGGFSDWFNAFRNTINYFQARYRFRTRLVSTDAITVQFNDERRHEIHNLLDKIKKVVANLTISDRKRDAIYSKIAALASEVDRSRTRIDALMAFILETSETAGEAAENLEPVIKLAERVRKLFARAQAEGQSGALPAPAEENSPKRITGPAVPQPRRSTQLDDDIPF